MHAPTAVFHLLLLSVLCFRGVESAKEYGVLSRSAILSKINSALEVEGSSTSGEMMNIADFRWLWKRLMFKDCTEDREMKKCNLCMKTDAFLKWYGHGETASVSEDKFSQYTVGIIYILTKDGSEDNSCIDFTSKVFESSPGEVPDLLLKKYGVKGSTVDATSVRRIFQDIGKNCGCLRSECFPASEDVPPKNGYVGVGAEYASMYVVMKLLDIKCLPYEPSSDEYAVKNILNNFQKVYSDAVLTRIDEKFVNGTKCYKRTDLENTLSNNRDEPVLTTRTVSDITPQFMKMIGNVSQAARNNDKNKGSNRRGTRKTWQPWIASFFSISIISFGSLIGIVCFSGKQRRYFNHVMSFLVSMGCSVLVCDAVLHLIPHALNFHGHIDGRHFKSSSWMWKCLMVLIGIYIFIMLELALSVFGFDHGHSHSHGEATEDHNLLTIKSSEDSMNGDDSLIDKGAVERKESFTIKSIKSVAWMILVGDGIHNFMDGVAIGGVFAEPFPRGLNGGIMTSIAIFIHEVPHELGDFAVLISSGLTIKQALILNLLSSLTAFIGGIVGITLGTHWNASKWIFAITGGLFIYISLVDMLPEVRRNPLLKKSPKLALFLDFCGFTFGLLILFFLAAYENKIENAL